MCKFALKINKYMNNLNRIKAVLAETDHMGKWLTCELGKDPVTISKWCTNTSQPDLPTLFRISELLKVDVSVLLVTAKSNQLLT